MRSLDGTRPSDAGELLRQLSWRKRRRRLKAILRHPDQGERALQHRSFIGTCADKGSVDGFRRLVQYCLVGHRPDLRQDQLNRCDANLDFGHGRATFMQPLPDRFRPWLDGRSGDASFKALLGGRRLNLD
jgi:hypothetical protein